MRLHRSRRWRAALGVTALALLAAPTASANVWTNVNDFNLTESPAYYPGSWNASAGTSGIEYRWLDVPVKETHIRAHSCATGAALWPSETKFPAGSSGTTYRPVGYQYPGGCFKLRGRTATGSGSMNLYDGRVSR